MYSHKLVGTGALIGTKVSGLGGYMTYFPMNMVEQTSTNVSIGICSNKSISMFSRN